MVQKARADLVDAFKQHLTFLLAVHAVGHQVNFVQTLVLDQDLDGAVSVGDRGGVVAHHDETARAGTHEGQHRRRNACGHVHDQVVDVVFEFTEGLHDAGGL